MSDFCKNCNHDSSYHTTAVGECLVDIWFAEICQLTLVYFRKSIHAFKKHRSFVWIYSQLQIHTMLYVQFLYRGRFFFLTWRYSYITCWKCVNSFSMLSQCSCHWFSDTTFGVKLVLVCHVIYPTLLVHCTYQIQSDFCKNMLNWIKNSGNLLKLHAV